MCFIKKNFYSTLTGHNVLSNRASSFVIKLFSDILPTQSRYENMLGPETSPPPLHILQTYFGHRRTATDRFPRSFYTRMIAEPLLAMISIARFQTKFIFSRQSYRIVRLPLEPYIRVFPSLFGWLVVTTDRPKSDRNRCVITLANFAFSLSSRERLECLSYDCVRSLPFSLSHKTSVCSLNSIVMYWLQVLPMIRNPMYTYVFKQLKQSLYGIRKRTTPVDQLSYLLVTI